MEHVDILLNEMRLDEICINLFFITVIGVAILVTKYEFIVRVDQVTIKKLNDSFFELTNHRS